MEAHQIAKQMARLLVMYDTPSDIEAFERHYHQIHVPLAKQLPGLRRYTVSHDMTPMIGEAYYLVVTLDWDDMEALGAALASDIGKRTGEDVANLARYAAIRGMTLQLDDR
jgi:uncharacterized protein (TIGR02118 family)